MSADIPKTFLILAVLGKDEERRTKWILRVL